MHHPTDRIATRELLFPISSKGYFIMHRPTDRIAHNTAFITPVVEHWLERKDTSRSWLEDYPRYSVMVDSLSYFLFNPVLHDWCNKGRDMCYPVCGMMHIN